MCIDRRSHMTSHSILRSEANGMFFLLRFTVATRESTVDLVRILAYRPIPYSVRRWSARAADHRIRLKGIHPVHPIIYENYIVNVFN